MVAIFGDFSQFSAILAYVMVTIFDDLGQFSAIFANFRRFWLIFGDFG
jgi:hypothetical protein